MNFRRGFFRLWLVFSALFVIATAVVSFSDVKSEFGKAYPSWSPPPEDLLMPVACSEARGKVGDDYEKNSYGGGTTYCWYSLGKFKALYPMLGIAVGVPLIVLAVGSAIGWSFAGFSGEQLKKKA